MKNNTVKFWSIFIIALVIICSAWFLTSFKNIKSSAWSFSLENNTELNTEINQINQSLEKILGLITTKPKNGDNNSDDNNDEVIQKIKHQIINDSVTNY